MNLQPLADAALYGPLMLYQARTVRHKYLRAGLTIAGLATVLYGLYRLRAELQAVPPAPELAGCGCAPGGYFVKPRRSPARMRMRAP